MGGLAFRFIIGLFPVGFSEASLSVWHKCYEITSARLAAHSTTPELL
jgi:hypothetical protein